MKQIQGSVRVKIKECVHAWSEFLFVSLLVILNFLPQINHFDHFTSLRGMQDVENHIFAFPMYYSLYNWTGEHEITKLKNIYLLRIQKKGHKNKHKKTWIKWIDRKWTIWYFQQCARVNTIGFAPVITTTYRMKNDMSSSRGLSLMRLCQSACAIVKAALH